MQRDIFLFGGGTIEIEFGFIPTVTQSTRRVSAPLASGFCFRHGPVWILRGSALQPEDPSSKQGKRPADTDDKGRKGKGEAVESALRSAYHNAVSEPVPDEMLDLLNKLG
ncbi:MAG: NepR family anti-sigma factor [Pseudomonadota bacterium]